MNKFNLLLTAIMFFSINAFCQLTGTKTVGGTAPDYATLSAAITALNSNGVGAGGVTFLVAADHVELLSNATITTTTSNATDSIVFVKNGVGANPRIVATAGISTTVDAIIKISGTDYVTFDGFTFTDTVTNTTTTTRMEFGVAIVKASGTDGCSNVTIKNCNVMLQKVYTSTRGIYIVNHTATSTSTITVSNLSGIHKNILIQNNNISNTYYGIYQTGSTTTTYYDDNITFDGNIITNFAGTSTTAYGIYGGYCKNMFIVNDSINGGTGQTTTIYGIYMVTSTGANILIHNNAVKLTTSLTTSTQYAISNAGGATGGTVNITNNRVEGSTSTTTTSGGFYGIQNSANAAIVNITGNLINNNTKNATTGLTYYIANSSGVNIKIYGNTVSNNVVTGSTTAVVYCILQSGGTNCEIYDNIVNDNARNTGTTPTLSGIYVSSGSNVKVFRNKVYGLTSTSTSAVVNGIQLAGGTEVMAMNNLIGNLSAASSTVNSAVNGINVTTTSLTSSFKILHNSIYLNATGTSNFGTNGIFVNTGPVVELSNNLVVNLSSSAGTGRTCAMRRSSTLILSYSDSSNNNYYYAGVPSVNNLIHTNGTNNYSTLGEYQSYISSTTSIADFFSNTGAVTFVSTTGSSADFLKVSNASATNVESGARIIAGLEGDYLTSNARLTYPQLGQTLGGGQLPDIGAYELDLIPSINQNGPIIKFKSLKNGIVALSRPLDNVIITHPAGVATTPGLAPRLYFRRQANLNQLAASNSPLSDGWKYVDASTLTSPYTFTIDYGILNGTLVTSDIIEYFIVAQDASNNPVVRINGATLASPTTSSTLTSAQFPVTGMMYSYTIGTPLSTTITVGATGADYTSLTRADGLFNAINNAVVTGNVSVTIISDVINENGAVALNEVAQDGPGAGSHIINIAPNGTNRYISGNVTNGMIKLQNTNNVIFDGEYLSVPNNIIFENKSTSTNAVFHIIGTSDQRGCNNITIKNSTIISGSKTPTTSYGVFIGGATITTTQSSGGFFNKYIRIINNKIYKVYHGVGILSHNISSADSISVVGNQIGNDTIATSIGAYGIRVTGLLNSNIARNRIFNVISSSTSITQLWVMHLLGGLKNVTVDGNTIDSVAYTTTQYNTLRAISITANPNANVIVKNNIINRMSGSGVDNSVYYGPVGLYIEGTGNDIKIYNNTFHLTGNRFPNTWTYVGSYSTYTYTLGNAYSAACAISSSTITGLDVRNNIFSNVQTSTNSSAGYNFAFYTSAPANSFSHLSHNLYYSASATASIYKGFYTPSGNSNTMVAFKNAMPIDKYSMFAKPGFVSDVDLNLNTTDSNIWNIIGRGMPLPSVATDAMGNPRSTSVSTGAIDLGAYEITTTPTALPPLATANALPAANTTTTYMYGQDTLASVTWGPFSAVPDTLKLRFYPGETPPNPTSGTNYMNAKWELTGTPSNGLDAVIRLHYSPVHLGNITNEANLSGATYAFSVWADHNANSTVDTVAKKLTINAVSYLGDLTGTDRTNPLPVSLLSFTGNMRGNDAILNWKTSTERNVRNFVVERNVTNNSFEPIATINAKGNSNKLINYTHTDADVFNRNNSAYYRLKMVDVDGKFTYSNVVALNKGTTVSTPTVYPNPFKTNLLFQNAQAGKTVRVFNIAGKEIITIDVKQDGEVTLSELNALKAGIYFVKIDNTTIKVVKE